MASPLAVLSEAAHVYEQMEQLKMAEQVKNHKKYFCIFVFGVFFLIFVLPL